MSKDSKRNELTIIFAIRLKKLLKDNGMRQQEYADKIGVGKSSVTQWLQGMFLPNLVIIVETAKLFHTTTDYLLGLTDVSTDFTHQECVVTGFSDAAKRQLVEIIKEATVKGR